MSSTSDIPLLREILKQMLVACSRIERRFIGIESPDDFLSNDAGIDKLDGITMMLIALGESIKRFEKKGGKYLLEQTQHIDWKGIKGTRDVLSHRYFDVDVEIVYAICSSHIEPIKQAFLSFLETLES
tara:strand:+ start:97 stop:480 length:384 start_codon:yes stop_codon:yes gene_type:complete